MSSSGLVKGVTKYGKGYRAYLTIPGGKPKAPVFPTASAANAWKQAADEAKQERRPIPPAVGAITRQRGQYQNFEQVSQAWVEHRRRNPHPGERFAGIEYSERLLRKHILPQLGSQSLPSISPEDIEGFRDLLGSKGYSVAYQRAMLAVISRIFAFAKSQKWVVQDPSHDVRPARPPGTVSVPLTAATCFQKGTPVDWELSMTVSLEIREMFRIGYWIQRICALRIGELFGLTLADWWPSSNTLLIHAQGGKRYEVALGDERPWRTEVTKTAAGLRVVVAPEPLAKAIAGYIRKYHEGASPDTRLIVTPLNGRSYSSYATEVATALRAHGVLNELGKPATSHYLRKLAVTNLFNANVDGRVASHLAGHQGTVHGASPVTTNIYDLGPSAELVQSEVLKLSDELARSGLTDLDAVDTDDEEYMPRIEAAIQLKRAEGTIRLWELDGLLTSSFRRSASGRCSPMVLRAEVDALIDSQADRWTLADAVDRFKIDSSSVLLAARLAGVPMERSSDGRHSWFLGADFDELTAEIETWNLFRARHLTLAEAADRLHTTTLKVRRMAKSKGGLTIVERPRVVLGVTGKAVWFRASDVAKIAALPRNTWLGSRVDPRIAKRFLTAEEAAFRLKRSAATVRRLVKLGALDSLPDAAGRRRIFIDPNSVKRYLESKANH